MGDYKMFGNIKKITICLLFILSLCFGITSQVNAKVFFETQIVSGTITDIRDNIIELDGYTNYYPANENLTIDLQIGTEVTIRYFISIDEVKKYLEYAPGLDTISLPDRPAHDKYKTNKKL